MDQSISNRGWADHGHGEGGYRVVGRGLDLHDALVDGDAGLGALEGVDRLLALDEFENGSFGV